MWLLWVNLLHQVFVTPKKVSRRFSCDVPRGGNRGEMSAVGGLCPSFGSGGPLTAANFEETGKARAARCWDGYPLWEAFPPLPHWALPLFISLCRPPAHFALGVALTL